MVQGFGFRVQGSGFRVQGSGFWVQELRIYVPQVFWTHTRRDHWNSLNTLDIMIWGLGIRFQVLGFRAWGSWFIVNR